MNELTDIVHQHANQITAAVRQINALHTYLQAMERQEPEQMKLAELTEVHLKILSDITALQKNIMSSQSQIQDLRKSHNNRRFFELLTKIIIEQALLNTIKRFASR